MRWVHLAQALVPLNVNLAFFLALAVGLGFKLVKNLGFVFVGISVLLILAFLNHIKRWLGDIQVALVDYLAEMAEIKRQKQGADVAAVNIGIGHNYNAMIARFCRIERVADSRPHSDNQRFNFLA